MSWKQIAAMAVACLAFGIMLNACSGSAKKRGNDEPTKNYDDVVAKIDFERHNASKNYVILVDYSIPSNRNRLFVYNLNTKEIEYGFWCAHGFGGQSTPETPEFSNTPGSNCSSLGLFKIERGEGTSANYGYKYHAVDGLSSTNSNARRRQILIHAWSSVTNDYEAQIDEPMNLDMRCAGCFTTTDEGYETLHRIIRAEKKRILLYAFT